MKKPSLLLTLSAVHAFIWSAGLCAVLTFLRSTAGGAGLSALTVWAATFVCFFALVGAHLFVARLVRRKASTTRVGKLED